MPYWLDVDGGMSFGEELVQAMQEGVRNCKIVILMISDAFCNSGNCLFEYINIVQSRKYVIPLLVPGWDPEGKHPGTDWWRHAGDIFKPEWSANHHRPARGDLTGKCATAHCNRQMHTLTQPSDLSGLDTWSTARARTHTHTHRLMDPYRTTRLLSKKLSSAS